VFLVLEKGGVLYGISSYLLIASGQATFYSILWFFIDIGQGRMEGNGGKRKRRKN
jgi:hypothetical protein